jgi:ATP/maltotriose-dependent transcriptional regulator MalT
VGVYIRLDAEKEIQIAPKITWISLDEGDIDQVCFLNYFIGVLNQREERKSTFGKVRYPVYQ